MTRVLARCLLILFVGLGALAACGGSAPIAMKDAPVYANATALEPGKNPIADTLAKNMQQAGTMGVNLEQKMFTLPADTAWKDVQAFYTTELEGKGWSSLSLPMPTDQTMQMKIWKRGNQSLTVAQLMIPTTNENLLLLSLSST